MWRPKLVVRFGKGGHTPSSPTTTAGYVLVGGIGGFLTVGCILAAFHGKPMMILGLLITSVFLRDVWAWFAATPAEREAFRQQVLAAGGGPDDRRVGGQWRWWQLLALGATTVAAFAMMYATLAFFPVAMMVLSVFVAASADRIREVFVLADECPRAWIRLVVRVAVCQMLLAPMPAAAQTQACRFHTGAALVADAVQVFEKERGRLPESVDELVTAGFLKVAPAGPDGRPLQIALRSDGTWAVTSSDSVIPPSRWACVSDHEIAGLAAVLLVAGCVVAFARTRRPVFLGFAAIAVVVFFAWAACTPVA